MSRAASVRRHSIKGAFFGFVSGLGVALLAISHGVLPLGRSTPIIVIVVLLLVGFFVGRAGPARRG